MQSQTSVIFMQGERAHAALTCLMQGARANEPMKAEDSTEVPCQSSLQLSGLVRVNMTRNVSRSQESRSLGVQTLKLAALDSIKRCTSIPQCRKERRFKSATVSSMRYVHLCLSSLSSHRLPGGACRAGCPNVAPGCPAGGGPKLPPGGRCIGGPFSGIGLWK